jgi:small subunit ribosomal protein S16
VATKIKLMRLGKMREPHYRIVVADARTKRDGRAIETIGEYHPKSDPSLIKLDGERAAYWLGVGAQPTEAVTAIMKATGDWQKFKGLPAPEPLRYPAAKPDKQERFNAALAEISGEPAGEATTAPKKRAAKAAKSTAKAAEPATVAEPATADDPADADEPAAAEAAAPTEGPDASATTTET